MVTRIDVAAEPESRLDIRTLTADHVDDLRLGWNARLQPEEVRRLLTVHPGRSVWMPETLEYAVVGPWRHRPEIAHLVDFSAVRHPRAIVEAVVDRCRRAGDALFVSVELDEVRRPIFYEHTGFKLLQEIVTYEWSGRRAPAIADNAIRFESVDPGDEAWRRTLIDIDHAAFPWLWQNSDLEFQVYAVTPGVEVYAGSVDGQPVAYLGLTFFPGWGHLDRIAVHPGFQGEGVGQAALAFTVQEMLRRGARRIGLSTQVDNMRSRRLYERFGFRRAPSNDYRLYGRLIGDAEEGQLARRAHGLSTGHRSRSRG